MNDWCSAKSEEANSASTNRGLMQGKLSSKHAETCISESGAVCCHQWEYLDWDIFSEEHLGTTQLNKSIQQVGICSVPVSCFLSAQWLNTLSLTLTWNIEFSSKQHSQVMSSVTQRVKTHDKKCLVFSSRCKALWIALDFYERCYK